MGESCGTALWAALQLARELDDPDALFVVLLPDSGRNYVGKLYSDDWLRQRGLLGADEQVADYDWRATRAEVVLRGARFPPGRLTACGRAQPPAADPALRRRRLGLLVAIDAPRRARIRAPSSSASIHASPESIGSPQSAHVR